MDTAWDPLVILYFIALIALGESFAVNLILGVILSAYTKVEMKDLEAKRLKYK